MLEFLIFAATVVVFLVFAVIYLYPGSKRPTSIPGPEPVDPLEGNIPDIASCGSLHAFLSEVHEHYGPIVSFWLGPKMCVSIAKANLFEEQSAVFDRPVDLFASLLPLIGENSIQVTNGAEGRRRHAAYSKCFHPSAVKSYMPVFNEVAKQLVEKWKKWNKDEYIPIREQCVEFSVLGMMRAIYGLEPDDQLVKRVRVGYDVCFAECDQQAKGDFPEAGSVRLKRFNQCKEHLYEVIRQAVRRRKEDSSSDSKDSLVASTLSLGLSDVVVEEDLITVFIAGFHTTASLLTWAIYYLAENPDIQERAQKEVVSVLDSVTEVNADHIEQMKYLQQIVDETLRIAASGAFAARQQEVDTMIGGHRIPAGTPVVQALAVALHDPEVYPDPDKFDPDRFSPENVSKLPPFAFEPFGFAGKRKCIGYRFSLTEAKTLLAVILRSNLRLVLAPDQTVIFKTNLVTFPSEEVWLSVEEPKEL